MTFREIFRNFVNRVKQGLTNPNFNHLPGSPQHLPNGLELQYTLYGIFYTFFWASETKKSLAQPKFGLDLGNWAMDLSSPDVKWSILIRYARTCSNYQDFMERGKVLTQKLLSQGYQNTKLVATLKKFYGRHHDLVNPYNVAVSRIVSDVFASDAP